MKRTLLLLPLLSSALFIACGDKDGDSGESHGAEACEAAGTGSDVTAESEPGTGMAMIHADESANVTLATGEVGYVTLHVMEAGDYILAAGTADVVAGLWLDGVDQGLGDGAALDECADDVQEHWDVPMQAGQYDLELGPAAVDSVWIGLFPEGGHDDHDHE